LAEWLFSPKHPLTARVFVNRMWMEFYGTGIVKSSEDFGNQGELPTHPELLDWMAVDFQEHHWDVKRLIREIVLSSTYQQADAISKHKQEVDPENRYLSRGPRIRMSAEMIRDNWLATSGLLNQEVGGPSVKPYQPEGLWEDTNPGRGPLMSYKQDRKKNFTDGACTPSGNAPLHHRSCSRLMHRCATTACPNAQEPIRLCKRSTC
jgi:hypothetical protein